MKKKQRARDMSMEIMSIADFIVFVTTEYLMHCFLRLIPYQPAQIQEMQQMQQIHVNLTCHLTCAFT